MRGRIISVIKNPNGVYGFIKCEGHPNYYYNTTSILKGNFLKHGDFVEFEIERLGKNKTKAIKVKKLDDKKIKKTLDVETKKKLTVLFEKSIFEKGFLEFTRIASTLNVLEIDYREYASDMSTFIQENWKGYFKIIKPFMNDSKTYTAVIVKSEKELAGEKVIRIREKLISIVKKEGFFEASMFPSYLCEIGIDDFQGYANDLDKFLEKFMPGVFVSVINFAFNGIIYPRVYMFSENFAVKAEDDKTSDIVCEVIQDTDNMAHLHHLYNEKEYDLFLRADEFSGIDPNYLSVEYMEMALSCAYRLLFPENDKNVVLNVFQRELFINSTSLEFIKKWKSFNGFDKEIIQACAESSIPNFVLPTDNGAVVKLLNKIGYASTLNNNYVGLTKRFSSCENELIPCLYLIRAFVQKSPTAVQRCIGEYCQLVKDIRLSSNNSKINEIDKMVAFPQILKSINDFILPLENLPKNLRTNIVSVFIECNSLEKLQQILPLLDPDRTSAECKLVDLFLNFETCSEDDLIVILDKKISLQLLQRVIALAWEKYSGENEISLQLIRILSWIIIHDNYYSIDEILRYHFSSSFTKRQKQLMLINSFEKTCEYTQNEPEIYLMASYIYLIVVQDLNDNLIPDNVVERIEKWEEFSQGFYEKKINEIGDINLDNSKQYIKLFSFFKLDNIHYLKVQKVYADWFEHSSILMERNADELFFVLDGLFQKKAYESFIRIFQLLNVGNVTSERIEQYVISLVEMQRYSDAILFVQMNTDISSEKKNNLLATIIIENFRINEISEKAFSILGESFSADDAIKIMLTSLKPNQYSVITALIALYCHSQEYCKVMYLYAIYQSKAENGFTRLFGKVRGLLKNVLNKIKNHYDVVELSFYSLLPNKIIEFLEWARFIRIPEIKGYIPVHAFSKFYDSLIENPRNEIAWNSFLTHLSKRIDKNAWMIFVCETILRIELDEFSSHNSLFALKSILMNVPIENDIPHNLLPYTYLYIMQSGNTEICSIVLELLKNEDIIDKIVSKNIWNASYSKIKDDFKVYCMDAYTKTGDDVFYQIMPLIGVDLSVGELGELAKSNVNKRYLFSEICNNYLLEKNWPQTVELLNSEEWFGLSKTDAAVLNILRLIYSDDDALLFESKLFENDESIQRFKKDCAEILRLYPSKEGLFEFDNNCINIEHKLRVYAYVVEAIYDEDIYDKYKLHFSNLDTPQVYYAYMIFLKRAFIVQLDRNVSYLFFYKKWRYLKLYINALLLKGDELVDISDIIGAMEANSHYEEIYQSTFVPFKNDIDEFWQIDTLSEEEKKAFLFSLMQGEMKEFILSYGGVFHKLTESQKKIMQKIVSYIDYREASNSVYQLFGEEIQSGNFLNAINIATALCDYTKDALLNMENMKNDTEGLALFIKMSCQLTRLECVNTAFSVQTFDKYASFIVPMVCSIQFIEHIYDKVRRSVIKGNQDGILPRFKRFSDYLATKQRKEVTTVYNYLYALKLAMEKDKIRLKSFLLDNDIESDIPAQWIDEMGRIIRCVNDDTYQFVPDISIKDSSRKGLQEDNDFEFVKRLKGYYQICEKKLTIEEALNYYKKFETNEISSWEKVNAGLMLLVNYPKQEDDQQQNRTIPPKKNLLLKIVLAVMSPEANISIDEQMAIFNEMFENRNEFVTSDLQKDMNQLDGIFANTLKKGFPLGLWVKYANTIEKYLREKNNLLDFSELKKRIISTVEEYIDDSVSQNKKYECYKELENSFNGLESQYARKVLEAIREECTQIENSECLDIAIVNQNAKITDGNVYYQIKNIGRRTVSLDREDIKIYFKQDDRPESDEIIIRNVNNLHSGLITGGSEKIYVDSDTKEVHVTISIRMKLPSGKTKLLCSTYESLQVEKNIKEFQITEETEYDVDSAVTNSDMLFGRQNLQNQLAGIIPKGVSVIYGPSRIGKTSLLNWVRKDLAKKRGNVISMLLGGEHGLGKGKDYSVKFYDDHTSIPYGSDKELSKYLLADTITYAFKGGSRRVRKPTDYEIPSAFAEDVIRIMNKDRSLADRYYELNKILMKEKIEVWILLDEFQEVVSKWHPQKDSDFIEICQMLLNSDPEDGIHNIKLVVCGSDELLRCMILDYDSVWKEAFPKSTRIAVEPLLEEPFREMISYDSHIVDSNIQYSDSALRALFAYTDGVALYGKAIGNTIIEDIRNRPKLYRGRNIIYVSDVASATQKLIKRQSEEINTSAKEGISEVYGAVTKGLNKETDMQYLWYMAMWLHTHPEADGFKESIFTQRPLLKGKQSLKDSLSIAEARGIIKNKNDQFEPIWVFRALFYYFAFIGSASGGDFHDNLIFDEEDEHIEEIDNPYTTDKIADYFEKVPGNMQSRLIGALAGSAKTEAIEKMKLIVGDTNAQKIGEQNIQINIQTIQINQIAESIASISDFIDGRKKGETVFDESKLEKQLKSMPQLKLLPVGTQVCAEDELSMYDTDGYVSTIEEGIRKSFDNNKDFAGKSIEDWAREHKGDLIGMGVMEEDLEYALNLQERDRNSIIISLYLRYLYDEIVEITSKTGSSMVLDYSPVTIMLGKTLERILNEKHLPVYLDDSVWINKVKTYSTDGKFQPSLISFMGFATIGTFTTALFSMFKIADADPEKQEKEENRDSFLKRTGLSSRIWKSYMYNLNEAKKIRNKTAHIKPVTQDECDQFMNLVFHSKLLKNTVEYISE